MLAEFTAASSVRKDQNAVSATKDLSPAWKCQDFGYIHFLTVSLTVEVRYELTGVSSHALFCQMISFLNVEST